MTTYLNQPDKKVDIKELVSYGGQYLILKQAQKKGIETQILLRKNGGGKKDIYIKFKKDNSPSGRSHWLSHQKGFFNSKLSCELALSKYLTYQVLESAKLPIPRYTRINQIEQIDQMKIPGPWVIKPISQGKGKDVIIKIKTKTGLKKVARRLFKKYRYLIVEQFVEGKDHRLLILDGKLLGAVKRIPARIKGDGKQTIKQLIKESNKKQRRFRVKELAPFLKKIKMDLEVKRCLAQKNLKLSSVPKKDKIILVRKNANFSTGGEIEDITKQVHPENIKIACKAIEALGLKLGGIDIITNDISQPITQNGGKINEINSIPALWIHHFPNHGKGRNVAGKIVDYLLNKSL